MASVSFKISASKQSAVVPSVAAGLREEQVDLSSEAAPEPMKTYSKAKRLEEPKFVIPLPSAIDAEAKRALLQEAEDLKNGVQPSTSAVDGSPISQIMSTLRHAPDVGKIEPANYESVPVEEYGLALLRGMGWKEGVPIGLNSKQIVHCVQPVLRPKGMGLGASAKRSGNESKEEDAVDPRDEVKPLAKGSLLKITGGPYRSSYGVAHSLDEDEARVIVKLALGGTFVTASQYAVQVVSKREYDQESKCLNKVKVEQYKQEKGQELIFGDVDVQPDREEPPKKSTKTGAEPKRKQQPPWLRPDLRVRIVDPRSKHFKKKGVIYDVPQLNRCTCRMEDGSVVEGVSQDGVDTVVPKAEGGYVLFIDGQWKGKCGKIVKRDVKRACAILRILGEDEVVTESFDNICEYIGDVSVFEQ